jgi:hypothetical protein
VAGFGLPLRWQRRVNGDLPNRPRSRSRSLVLDLWTLVNDRRVFRERGNRGRHVRLATDASRHAGALECRDTAVVEKLAASTSLTATSLDRVAKRRMNSNRPRRNKRPKIFWTVQIYRSLSSSAPKWKKTLTYGRNHSISTGSRENSGLCRT